MQIGDTGIGNMKVRNVWITYVDRVHGKKDHWNRLNADSVYADSLGNIRVEIRYKVDTEIGTT